MNLNECGLPPLQVFPARVDVGLLRERRVVVTCPPADDRDRHARVPLGKDAVVFHHSVHSGQPADPPYIEQTRAWFNAMWDNISYEFPA